MRARMVAASLTACLFGVGCSTTKQARSVTPAESGEAAILGDYGPLLQKGEGDEALLRYETPGVAWPDYTKAIVMPVKFEKSEKLQSDSLEDLQKLADASYVLLVGELGQVFEIVIEPDANTLRVEAAFYGAQKKKTVLNVISGVIPIGVGLNVIAVGLRGKPLSVGELSGEMKITDASSGGLLLAGVDRRVGRKYQSA